MDVDGFVGGDVKDFAALVRVPRARSSRIFGRAEDGSQPSTRIETEPVDVGSQDELTGTVDVATDTSASVFVVTVLREALDVGTKSETVVL